MTKANNPDAACRYKHRPFWMMLSAVLVLLVGTLTCVAGAYRWTTAQCEAATTAASKATEKAEEVENQLDKHAAVAAEQAKGIERRLDSLGTRQVSMDKKIEHVIDIVVDIRKNGHKP